MTCLGKVWVCCAVHVVLQVVPHCLINIVWTHLHHSLGESAHPCPVASSKGYKVCMLPSHILWQHLVVLQQAQDLFQARDVPIVVHDKVAEVLFFLCGLCFSLFDSPFLSFPCLKIGLNTSHTAMMFTQADIHHQLYITNRKAAKRRQLRTAMRQHAKGRYAPQVAPPALLVQKQQF